MAGTTSAKDRIAELFKNGAHFGFVKSRRHPSARAFILGQKDGFEIFDLEKTEAALEKAAAFLEEKGREAAVGIFVGGKSEAREAVAAAGRELSMPFVNGRWIGGTLTNFSEIKKRLAKLEERGMQKEKGELAKYTKKERLLIDREVERLENFFGGIAGMKALPKFLVVIDPKKESIAVAEARRIKIPVVAVAGSDSDLFEVDFAIPANDASRHAVGFITKELVAAYKRGLADRKVEEPAAPARA